MLLFADGRCCVLSAQRSFMDPTVKQGSDCACAHGARAVRHQKPERSAPVSCWRLCSCHVAELGTSTGPPPGRSWDARVHSGIFANDLFLCFSPAIGRTLIPRYFSTVFEGGVTDLYYILKHSKESYHNSSITVDCDQCAMVTQHGKPMFTKVCTEGRLILEFTFDDLMRIKTWHFTIRQYRELVPRSILAMHVSF
ncbi:LIM domain-binding protein 2 [Galemys pyrenaicus]|uniref:LIM domain-binding protein 2 n=1 Tax=Galemys pyrenaicus TaxID=202257 RepID=A0A8J6A280_GALPY|nr:LIM domain-binding protein 2 [Galemys pyrenaicus]